MVKATKKTHYLTQDVVPSTSASKPKTVKICHRQPCSKCSKKIRNPKVSIVLSQVISPPPAILTLS
ncbi:mCG1037283, isoform CRA_a [Mus musculus]|nr:mCG1037283, isoform CRA_a [Mus musculus]